MGTRRDETRRDISIDSGVNERNKSVDSGLQITQLNSSSRHTSPVGQDGQALDLAWLTGCPVDSFAACQHSRYEINMRATIKISAQSCEAAAACCCCCWWEGGHSRWPMTKLGPNQNIFSLILYTRSGMETRAYWTVWNLLYISQLIHEKTSTSDASKFINFALVASRGVAELDNINLH